MVRTWSQAGFGFESGYMASRSASSTGVTADNGTDYLSFLNWSSGEAARIVQMDGTPFDVSSVDLAEYSTVFPLPKSIRFVGTKLGGARVEVTFRTDGLIDRTGGVPDFETFTFPPTFTDLVILEIPTGTFALDNLVISPTPAFTEVQSADAVSATSAVLRGRVNPQGRSTEVSFEIKRSDTQETRFLEASESPLGVSTLTPVSVSVTDLLPYTSYTFRIRTVQSAGTTFSATEEFTTLNRAPALVSDIVIHDGWPAVVVDVLDNDSDPDGDALRITSFTQGAFGAVSMSASALIYTPGPDYFGSDSFEYTISDGFNGTAAGTVSIRSVIPLTRLSVTSSTGGQSPTPGDEVPGEEGAATFKTVGVPAINGAGTVAFLATLETPAGEVPAVFDGQRIVARRGDAAPQIGSGTFERFSDPALNGEGAIAFIARLREGVGTSSTEALYTTMENVLVQVVRTGEPIPGLAGATLGKVTAFQLLDKVVFFSGRLSGVAATSSFVVCLWTPDSGVQVLLQTGAELGGKRVGKIAALLPAPTSVGHGSSDDRTILARVTFSDDSQAVVQVDTETVSILARSDDQIPGMAGGDLWARFGVPALNRTGGMAFLATVEDGSKEAAKLRSSGLFVGSIGGPLEVLALTGERVDGLPLSAMSDPVYNAGGDVVAQVNLTTAPRKGAGSRGILFIPAGSDPVLVARTGDEAPGVAGANWKSFQTIALPDGLGPLFTARLSRIAGLVTADNDVGLWGVDGNGVLQLLAREGDVIDQGGSLKTVRKFTVLAMVPGSPGQTRSFNHRKELVYHADFTDGSQGIVRVQVP